MKKFALGILCGAVLATVISVKADEIETMVGKTVQGEFPVYLREKTLSANAIVLDGTSYVPVRELSEKMGYSVDFDASQGIMMDVVDPDIRTIQADGVSYFNLEDYKMKFGNENKYGQTLFFEMPNALLVGVEVARTLTLRLNDPKVIRYSEEGQLYIKADLYPRIKLATGMAYEKESKQFQIALLSEKREYAVNEAVKLSASIEYVGDEKEITVGHYSDAVFFTIQGIDNSVNIEAFRDYPIKQTKIIKGSPQTVNYKPSATYLLGDPNANIYKSFAESGTLPLGTYKVKARAVFDMLDKDNRVLAKYNIPLNEIEIIVK